MNQKLTYLMTTYFHKLPYQDKKLSANDAALYFSRAIATGNIVFHYNSDNDIIGYLDIWRVDKDQLARLFNYECVDCIHENLTRGEFVFISDLFVEPEYRGKSVARKLKRSMEQIQRSQPYLGVVMDDFKYQRRLRIMKRDSEQLYSSTREMN